MPALVYTPFVIGMEFNEICNFYMANRNIAEEIEWVNTLSPEARNAMIGPIHSALSKKRQVLTESVFVEEHNQTLDFYYSLCKEFDREIDPMLIGL